MKIYAGDIVSIKNIRFYDGKLDHAKKGRPCIVLYVENYENKKYVTFLPLSTRMHHLEEDRGREVYLKINGYTGTHLVCLDSIYTKEVNSDIKEPEFNIGKEFITVIDKLIKNTKKTVYLDKIRENILENKQIINETLAERNKYFKEKTKIQNPTKGQYANSTSGAKLEHGKISHIKKKALEFKHIKEEERQLQRELNY